MLRITICEKVL